LNKLNQELSKENIIFLILPALLISAFINLLIAAGIGLYSSRKYAVPIYKLEQWASLLTKGKITAILKFREKEEMKELSDKCNRLSSDLHARFLIVKSQVNQLMESGNKESAIILQKAIDGLEIGDQPIEVNTGIFSVTSSQNPKEKD
jgi:signal transduction histidine kinase